MKRDVNDSTTSNCKSHLRLERDPDGRLALTDAAGFRYVGVEVVRAFPLSEPTEWISFCDSDGREIATIESVAALDEDSRATLTAEMSRREFLPVIQRIVSVALKTEPAAWTVETDRGSTTFYVEGSDAVRRLEGERCLVVDLQGVRYLIADRLKLDAASRKWLDHYL
jgi:hypothetical protein